MNRAVSLLAFIAFLFSSSALEAGPPTDVVGIRWGAAPSTVRQAMSMRPGVTFAEETPTYILFRGGQFATKDVENWRFEFTEGKFTKAVIRFVRSSLRDADGWLNDQNHRYVHDQLVQKYGKPKQMSDRDHRQTVWTFPDALIPGAAKTITLYYRWFNTDRRITLTYSDDRPTKAKTPGTPNPKEDL
jgi:hypothetical protein